MPLDGYDPDVSTVTIRITLEFLSEQRTEWCDRCFLPSRESIDTVMLVNDVPTCVGVYSACASGCDEVDPG